MHKRNCKDKNQKKRKNTLVGGMGLVLIYAKFMTAAIFIYIRTESIITYQLSCNFWVINARTLQTSQKLITLSSVLRANTVFTLLIDIERYLITKFPKKQIAEEEKRKLSLQLHLHRNKSEHTKLAIGHMGNQA